MASHAARATEITSGGEGRSHIAVLLQQPRGENKTCGARNESLRSAALHANPAGLFEGSLLQAETRRNPPIGTGGSLILRQLDLSRADSAGLASICNDSVRHVRLEPPPPPRPNLPSRSRTGPSSPSRSGGCRSCRPSAAARPDMACPPPCADSGEPYFVKQRDLQIKRPGPWPSNGRFPLWA